MTGHKQEGLVMMKFIPVFIAINVICSIANILAVAFGDPVEINYVSLFVNLSAVVILSMVYTKSIKG